MSKIRIPIYIIGAIILCLASSLITYFSLAGVGIIEAEKIELVYELSDSSKEYDSKSLTLDDSNVTLKDGTLLEGHYAKYSFEGSITDVGVKEASLTVKIFDEKNHDVTDKYLISSNLATLTVEPKKVEIEIDASEEIVYNGEKLVYDSFEVTYGSLAIGHSFEPKIKSSVSVPDKTISTDDVIPFIFDKSGNDVTKNYEIELKIGDTKIVKRSIVVKPCDEEFTYDGTLKQADEIEFLIGNLVDGHRVAYELTGESLYAGEIQTKIQSISIYDELGNNVTDYYSVDTTNFGKLKINKKDLIVQAGSDSKVYDGEYLQCKDYKADGLAFGDKVNDIEFATRSSIKNAGSIKNEISSCSIVNSNGVDVTENYNIVYENGTLNIIKADLELTARSFFKTYDGKALTAASDNPNLTNADLLYYSGLISNEEKIYFNYKGSVTNAETAVNTIVDVSIYNGSENVTDNYNIIIIEGELTVTPKYLLIDGKSASKEYDGEELYLENDGTVLSCSGLANDLTTQDITVTYTSSIKDIGIVKNYFFVVSIGNELLSNYDIEYNFGTLEITKKKVTIKGKSNTKVYDGSELTLNNSYQLDNNGGLDDYIITFNYNASITNVGKVENTIENLIIKDYSGYNVTNNFDITIINGTLEVTKKPIEITASSFTKVYDGTVLSTNGQVELFDNINGLITGEKALVTYSGAVYNVGEKGINFINSVSIINGSVDNYDITYINGTLEITKATITLKANSYEKVYDGYDLSYEGLDLTQYDLEYYVGIADGDVLNIKYIGSQTFVGEAINEIEIIGITRNGVDVMDCYDLDNSTIINGTLKVTKANLRLVTLSENFGNYDGTIHSIEDDFFESNVGLAENDNISVTYKTEIVNAGTKLNTVTLDDIIILNNGNDAIDNYNITIEYGILTVEKANLSLVTISEDFGQYDGTIHKVLDTGFDLNDGLADTDRISVIYKTEIAGAGSVLNVVSLDDITILNDNDENVKDNYNITIEYGTLEVTKANLTLTSKSSTKAYDGTPLTFEGSIKTIADLNAYSGLASGESIEFVYNGSITNVGSVDNLINENSIKISGYSYSSVNNYNITQLEGTLEVTKANLNLVANSYEYDYTGYEVSLNGLTQDNLLSYSGLGSSHLVYNMKTTTSPLKAGIYDYTIEVVSITDNNDFDVSEYYNITSTEGTIKINKVNLVLEAIGGEFTYDSKAHTYSGSTYDITGLKNATGLMETDSISFNYTGAITYVGTNNNKITNVVVENGIIDVTDCYTITLIDGTLKVNKVDLVIKAESASKVYDGTILTLAGEVKVYDSTSNVVSYGTTLGVNDKINIEYMGSILKVGTAINEISRLTITSGTNDVTNCYSITAIDGTLEITKAFAKLEFTKTSLSVNYTGNAAVLPDSYIKLTGELANLSDYTLIAEDYTKVYNSNSNKLQVYKVKVLTSTGDVVTDCFDIDYSSVLRVYFNQRSLVLNVKDLTVNAGKILSIADLIDVSNLTPLVSGDYFDTSITIEITTGMSLEDLINEINNNIIITNNEDVTYDYDITYSGGSLTII